ncbi:MAG TPA: Hsp70 family protein [Rectinemataceae bacterium]|nr:Hsp70 family protein [Rectinemataceae bacterium]
MDKIGIKLANSEFYPILDHGRPARKRLVVTTVNDGQKSVQIDLYRGEGGMVTDAAYVGSLVVEDIPPEKAGLPDIRLDVELDESDMLKCTAVEAETGATQSIRVSLESLGEENSYEIPDFDLDEEETDQLPVEATSPEEGASLLSVASELREREKRRPILIWILGILILVLLGFLVWYLFFSGKGGPARDAAIAPATQSAAPLSSPPASAPVTPAPAPATSAPAATALPAPGPSTAAVTPAAPAATAAPKTASVAASTGAKVAPKAGALGGKRYRLKWGDTLWDLAWVHYRDPWLYPRIAKANKIRNPDHIIAGTWIVIPPL